MYPSLGERSFALAEGGLRPSSPSVRTTTAVPSGQRLFGMPDIDITNTKPVRKESHGHPTTQQLPGRSRDTPTLATRAPGTPRSPAGNAATAPLAPLAAGLRAAPHRCVGSPRIPPPQEPRPRGVPTPVGAED